MYRIKNKLLLFFIFTTLIAAKGQNQNPNTELLTRIRSIEGLVALWDFKEETGSSRNAYGLGKFPLHEINGKIERVNEGPLSGYSSLFDGGAYLSIANANVGELNIHGANQGVTVMAWVKWKGGTGFVGGMWNEYQDGGKKAIRSLCFITTL